MLLRDLLAIFPQCRLLTGAAALDRTLRWVHVVEQPDIANWLRNGDLVLVSGVGWSRDPQDQRLAVRQMIEAGVAGIFFAAGRFLQVVPEAVLSEAEGADFPVIEAPFDLRFADIAEAAQRTIIGEYFEVTERADTIHRALTRAALQAGDLGALADHLSELLLVEVTIYGGEGKVLGWPDLANGTLPGSRLPAAGSGPGAARAGEGRASGPCHPALKITGETNIAQRPLTVPLRILKG